LKARDLCFQRLDICTNFWSRIAQVGSLDFHRNALITRTSMR
jgi:hypothetical protein